MKLARKDIASGNVDVDYATLEKVVQDDKSLPTMYLSKLIDLSWLGTTSIESIPDT